MTRYDDLPLYEPEGPRRRPGRPSGRRPWSDARKKRLRRSLGFIAAFVALVLVVSIGYVGYNYLHLVGGITKIGGVIGGKDAKPGVAQNILLIGDDQRPANMTAQQYTELSTTPDDGSDNTDTMIVLHVPADGKSATLISFPRDSLVAIPGYGQNKINAAYVFGRNNAKGTDAQKEAAGVKLLVDTIQNLTGLTIDHYVKVSLLSFYNIAKSLGPVTVCLNNAVNDPYSGAKFPAGVQQLDARQALQFVRQRHGLPNGDFDRAARQQYFLSVEAQQILSAGTLLNPVKLNNVVGAIGSSLETDDKLNLVSLATQLKGLRSGNIHSATIPMEPPPLGPTGTATVGGVRGISVDLIDYSALPDFIAGITGQPTAAQKVAAAKAADPSSVTVDALNGAGTARGSSTALATLKSAGFQIGQPANAPAEQPKTTIYYPAGQESAAKAVSLYLPGAAIATSSQYKNVTVILGTDGLMPSASPQTAAAPSSGSGSSSQQPSSGSGSSSASSPSATPSTKSYSKTSCID